MQTKRVLVLMLLPLALCPGALAANQITVWASPGSNSYTVVGNYVELFTPGVFKMKAIDPETESGLGVIDSITINQNCAPGTIELWVAAETGTSDGAYDVGTINLGGVTGVTGNIHTLLIAHDLAYQENDFVDVSAITDAVNISGSIDGPLTLGSLDAWMFVGSIVGPTTIGTVSGSGNLNVWGSITGNVTVDTLAGQIHGNLDNIAVGQLAGGLIGAVSLGDVTLGTALNPAEHSGTIRSTQAFDHTLSIYGPFNGGIEILGLAAQGVIHTYSDFGGSLTIDGDPSQGPLLDGEFTIEGDLRAHVVAGYDLNEVYPPSSGTLHVLGRLTVPYSIGMRGPLSGLIQVDEDDAALGESYSVSVGSVEPSGSIVLVQGLSGRLSVTRDMDGSIVLGREDQGGDLSGFLALQGYQHGAVTINGSVTGTVEYGPENSSDNPVHTGTLTIAGAPLADPAVPGDLNGQILIDTLDDDHPFQGEIRIYGSFLDVPNVDYEVMIDRMGDDGAFVVDWDESEYLGSGRVDVWEDGAQVLVGATTCTGNNPAAHAFFTSPCHGDMNNDYIINSQDIDGFVAGLFDQDPGGEYDLLMPGLLGSLVFHGDFDNDGLFNSQDIDGFVTCLFGNCPCPPEQLRGEGESGGNNGLGEYTPANVAALLMGSVASQRQPYVVAAAADLANNGPNAEFWAEVLEALE